MENVTSASEVKDLRKRPRFELTADLPARFNGASVKLVDISAGGLQMEHAEAMRIGSPGTLFIAGQEALELPSRIVWSKLTGAAAAAAYRSGVAFTDIEPVAGKLGRLIRAYGRAERGSLERKRERMLARQATKLPKMIYINVPQASAEDDTLMIQQARQRLAASPEEALKWYNRARFALTERIDVADELANVAHRQEVLAVWEYLDRRFPIAAIVEGFQRKP